MPNKKNIEEREMHRTMGTITRMINIYRYICVDFLKGAPRIAKKEIAEIKDFVKGQVFVKRFFLRKLEVNQKIFCRSQRDKIRTSFKIR